VKERGRERGRERERESVCVCVCAYITMRDMHMISLGSIQLYAAPCSERLSKEKGEKE